MRSQKNTNSSRIFLPSTPSSATCREGELLATERNARRILTTDIEAMDGLVIKHDAQRQQGASTYFFLFNLPLHFEINGPIHPRLHVMSSSPTIAELMSGSLPEYTRPKIALQNPSGWLCSCSLY
ncbi:hypothetical protein G9A89_019911 [Geosiphon pyriformis]|nr:hypothetical protein G9A89_019911 [Geosiphon pyriformis]